MEIVVPFKLRWSWIRFDIFRIGIDSALNIIFLQGNLIGMDILTENMETLTNTRSPTRNISRKSVAPTAEHGYRMCNYRFRLSDPENSYTCCSVSSWTWYIIYCIQLVGVVVTVVYFDDTGHCVYVWRKNKWIDSNLNICEGTMFAYCFSCWYWFESVLFVNSWMIVGKVK